MIIPIEMIILPEMINSMSGVCNSKSCKEWVRIIQFRNYSFNYWKILFKKFTQRISL